MALGRDPERGGGRGARRRGDGGPSRRIVVGGLAAGGVAALAPDRGRASEAEPAEGDRLLISGSADTDQLLKPDLLTPNARPVTVFPIAGADGAPKDGNRLNRMLALRLEEAEMDAETRAASAAGVVVYSALCTHKACTIKAWKEAQRHLRCHCHLSEFAALNMGAVRKGPARSPLALAPVHLDAAGYVQLAGGFNRKPGPRG